MIEALWSIRVSVNGAPANAGGVVLIETGRVLGGDSSFIWTGDIKTHDSVATARMHIRQYQKLPGITSVTGLDDYWVTFKGKVDKERMLLTGSPDGHPSTTLTVEIIRRAELP